ncbi:MAG: hypothetical protein JWN48_5286 [Myxococcaceae bacterium]|nr:hypothetical protein [Myxococcaceae bacterium]
MTGDRENQGITLADGVTGGQVLQALLQQAVAEFPDAFGGLELPADPAVFKASYSELLPVFEAARVQSEQRSEIARALCLWAAGQLRYVDEQGERPLTEALFAPAEPLKLVRVDLKGAARLTPSVDYAGRLYVGAQLANLAAELDSARFVTRAVVSALTDIARRAQEGAGLSLRGQRFVLFGAGAELSPVYTLLEAGADVLWLDRHKPPIDRLLEPRLAGSLSYVDRGVDLLTQPAQIRATILDFAAGQPVHLGLYAFATGSACPLRLSLGMNALARSLPSELVRSISLLLSPTSVQCIANEDAEQAAELAARASKLRRTLLRAGTLQRGHLDAGDKRVSRAVVSQQGAAYQVAEYVGKRLAAEALVEFGLPLSADPPEQAAALMVSANMAPITATRSLASPVLEAAVRGAPSFDMMVAPPSTSRAVSALLLLHDLGKAERPSTRAERLSALFAQQFHGGVHAQPYALEGIMRVTALKGIAQRPKLAFELLR